MLQSAYLPDIEQEFATMGIRLDVDTIRRELNPSLTFKFGNLTPGQGIQVSRLLANNNLTHWNSESRDPSAIIISFPDWQGVEKLALSLPEELHPAGNDLREIQKNYFRTAWTYHTPLHKDLKIDRPLIMGILNVTPDSFSDGGRFFSVESACQQALAMAAAGADVIDIGGESTRPGAAPVGLEEEWQRLQPVLKKLAPELRIPVSIDTYKAEIARRALQEGAGMVNDISGLMFDPKMPEVVAAAGCPLVLMHIQGKPRDMQADPHYDNLMEELYHFFARQIHLARAQGISQLFIDPGIGFGKRYEDNFEIIRRLGEYKVFGYPVLIGISRKSFIGRLLDRDSGERSLGTAAATALAVNNGASVVRVHDVAEIDQVIRVVDAINTRKISSLP